MATKTVFTICSNNYLGQAIVLGNSVRLHDPESTFVIVLADRKSDGIDYAAIPFEVFAAEEFEPRTDELVGKYTIVEFNTCIKPRVFEYLFEERGVERAVYLDPDIRLYGPLAEMDRVLDDPGTNIALTPHITTPISLDGKHPRENLFLSYGIYNLGFIGAKKSDESLAMMRWWKERTYTAGFIRPDAGMFVDQLYVNLVPMLFKGVSVINHEGYNMAPWNLHERVLSRDNGAFVVNGQRPLVFFHFSAFRVDSGELPLFNYNRFTMKDRADLVQLYADYNEDLKNAGHGRYAAFKWAYGKVVAPTRLNLLKKRGRALCRTGVMWGLQRLPPSLTERAYKILKDSRG